MSHRKIVMLPGRLEGMGRVEDCTVGAVRVTHAVTSQSALSRITVHRAPDDLPEGRYILTYRDGLQAGRMDMQKNAVGWIAARAF